MCLRDLSREFLKFLRFNRNVSPHTLRAYDTDIAQWLSHLGAIRARPVSALTLQDFDTDGVRSYLGELYERGHAKASTARRLSGVRAFAKYLVREELLAGDPTALIGALFYGLYTRHPNITRARRAFAAERFDVLVERPQVWDRRDEQC